MAKKNVKMSTSPNRCYVRICLKISETEYSLIAFGTLFDISGYKWSKKKKKEI